MTLTLTVPVPTILEVTYLSPGHWEVCVCALVYNENKNKTLGCEQEEEDKCNSSLQYRYRAGFQKEI